MIYSKITQKYFKIILFLGSCFFSSFPLAKPLDFKVGKNVLGMNTQGQSVLHVPITFLIQKNWKLYAAPKATDTIQYPPKLETQIQKLKLREDLGEKSIKGPINIRSLKVQWPSPLMLSEKQGPKTVNSSAYKNQVTVVLEIQLHQFEDTAFSIHFEGLVCGDTCVPIKEDIPVLIETQYLKGKEAPSQNDTFSYGLKMLLFGLLGGIILNFMPCVLPVLGLKIQSLTRASPIILKASCIYTFFGILFSFWILALITLALKHIFQYEAGWGLPLQNPYSLAFLCALMVFFSLSLFGVFHFKTPTFVEKLMPSQSSHRQKAFFSGMFSTLLATPCSAPMLGPAIGFALQGSVTDIFLMFHAIAFGFSLPYLLGIFFPKQLSLIIPKPGKWSIYLEYVVAALFLMTAFWLASILSAYLSTFQKILSGSFLTLIIGCALSGVYLIKNKLYSKILLGISVLSGVGFLISPFLNTSETQSHQITLQEGKILFQPFSQEALDKALRDGKIVFIDVTATWCQNCAVNKWRVLMNDDIQFLLTQPDIVCLRGDVTVFSQSQHLWKFLKKYNRAAVPFNLLISKKHQAGIILSEWLSIEEIQKTVDFLRQLQGAKK